MESADAVWRWRWDLNPRRGCPLTRFRGVRPRPLGDSTAGELTRISLVVASARGEELPQDRAALLRQDAADHLGLVVQPRVPQHVPERPRRPRLRVLRP